MSWVLQQPLYVDSGDPRSSTELQLVITTARAGIVYTQNDQSCLDLHPASAFCDLLTQSRAFWMSRMWLSHAQKLVCECVCVYAHGIIWPRVSERMMEDWLQARSRRKPQCSGMHLVLCIPEEKHPVHACTAATCHKRPNMTKTTTSACVSHITAVRIPQCKVGLDL